MVRAGDEWPEHPLKAVYHDNEGWFGWSGHGWVVAGAPPPPFPFIEEPVDRALYGPEGTVWIFTLADLALGYAHLPSQPTLAALNAALKKLGHTIGSGPIEGWRTLRSEYPPAETPGVRSMMKWIRTQIVGTIGQNEEVVHVLNWRHSTIENADADAVQVKILGNAVRNGFAQFLVEQGFNLAAVVKYTEVRSSLLVQDAPGVKPVWPGQTQISPFAPDTKGTGNTTVLPYEVAWGLSFNTNFRGTSRFRGRLYLGALDSSVLQADGLFAGNRLAPLGASFGTKVFESVENTTDYEPHVISQKYNTSAKITGIRVGAVPDSQRRRRRDLVENYVQAWGAAVGAA